MKDQSGVNRPEQKQREQLIYDPRNERVVIGAAIADAEKRKSLSRAIAADEFLVPNHAGIWRAMRVLVDQNLTYDGELFRRLVADEGLTIDDAYLTGLEAEACVPDNLDWHLTTLRWDATKARVMQGALPELLKSLKDTKASADLVATNARAVLRSLEGGQGRKYMRRKIELRDQYYADVQARTIAGNFYPFGYDALDAHLVEGSAPGKTCVVAGLSGSGKSTFCADWAIRLAKMDRRVLYCAYEMGAISTLDIMVSSITNIEIVRVVQGKLSDDELVRVRKAVSWITSKITFMENAFFSEELRRGKRSNDRNLDLFESYIAESGCDVIICDLWERVLADLSYDAVTMALYRQQQMFQEYNVFGVIVHQLRGKDVEKRPDKRPTREAIKGTGAFVEVADLIFGIHREAQFKNVPDTEIETLCLKQRKGEANWSVAFEWSGARSRVGGHGRDVSFDPGLEDVMMGGGIDDVQTNRTKQQRTRTRREG